MRRASTFLVSFAIACLPPVARAELVAHTIAEGIGFGYQVLATDLNRDDRPDIVALGARTTELVWFENPGWERHVITADAPAMINLDAADTDGDGIPEIGLAYGFSTSPVRSAGNIAILQHSGDPTQPWTLTEIDQLPASHRLRFGNVDGRGPVLFNQPLATAIEQLEREFIARALELSAGRVTQAAGLLGLSRKGLFLKRRRLGLPNN